jgi:hypothetical protein
MIEKSLKKLLLTMLKDEYPQIKDIVIETSDLGDLIVYRVGIGIKYNDLLELDKSDENILKVKIKDLSKYVLGKNEFLETPFFYDPQDSY